MTHRIDGKERLTMRGWDNRRDGLFSYVRPESRIPSNHPLRPIRGVAAQDSVLEPALELDPRAGLNVVANYGRLSARRRGDLLRQPQVCSCGGGGGLCGGDVIDVRRSETEVKRAVRIGS